MIDYNIISSGSKGNAVVINQILQVDCGVPFKALHGVYQTLRLVLLTHKHSDHFRESTIQKLAFERPTLRFCSPEWLVGDLVGCGVNKANIDICTEGYGLTYSHGLYVEMFGLTHDVPNCGYKIHVNGKRLLYATDTNEMKGIEARHYDLYMVEANYKEKELLERIRSKEAAGLYSYEFKVLENHLSEEKAIEWLLENMGPNSQYILMHGHEE